SVASPLLPEKIKGSCQIPGCALVVLSPHTGPVRTHAPCYQKYWSDECETHGKTIPAQRPKPGRPRARREELQRWCLWRTLELAGKPAAAIAREFGTTDRAVS